MAAGDPTLINHGVWSVSGADLKTAVDAITLYHPLLSGSSLHFVPVSNGNQIQLLQVDMEGAG